MCHFKKLETFLPGHFCHIDKGYKHIARCQDYLCLRVPLPVSSGSMILIIKTLKNKNDLAKCLKESSVMNKDSPMKHFSKYILLARFHQNC